MTIINRLSDKLLLVESGCWEFIGARNGAGYGKIWYKHKVVGAHVVTYELNKGNIPKGMLVCHTCDNKICCNPDHLFLGTHQDNKNDEISKDRNAYGERIGTHKLKQEDVIKIRQLIEEGLTLTAIGKIFNVNCASIWNVKNRVTWGHL